MPNIPTREPVRERAAVPGRPVQNQVQRPAPPQQRSTQGRVPVQAQQGRVQVQQTRHSGTSQTYSQGPRSAADRIKPIQPSRSAAQRKSAAQKSAAQSRKKKSRRQREHTTLGDCLLSFVVALFVFGVAAIFVCNALISLFT